MQGSEHLQTWDKQIPSYNIKKIHMTNAAFMLLIDMVSENITIH